MLNPSQTSRLLHGFRFEAPWESLRVGNGARWYEISRLSCCVPVVWHLNVRMRPLLSWLALNLRFYAPIISN
ncbi:hypothetical protein EPK84_14175 (plasmid) [Sinorhizobium fredii]|nr:hypothetical protein EPK84_12570 [Sinorhizobium fredii]UTY47811.1 hypothetical protein EPK84_14175 [Sinorhizobium fredii]